MMKSKWKQHSYNKKILTTKFIFRYSNIRFIFLLIALTFSIVFIPLIYLNNIHLFSEKKELKMYFTISLLTFLSTLFYELVRHTRQISNIELKVEYEIIHNQEEYKHIWEELKAIEYHEDKMVITNAKIDLWNYEELNSLLTSWNDKDKNAKGYLILIKIKNEDIYTYAFKCKDEVKKIQPSFSLFLVGRQDNVKFKLIKIKKGAIGKVFNGF